ncbi:hypothetical protein I317_07755, partial [Kwoniella heveanensis CBS 569]
RGAEAGGGDEVRERDQIGGGLPSPALTFPFPLSLPSPAPAPFPFAVDFLFDAVAAAVDRALRPPFGLRGEEMSDKGEREDLLLRGDAEGWSNGDRASGVDGSDIDEDEA